MPPFAFLFGLERVGSSYLLLGTFVALGMLAAVLFYTGALNVVIALAQLLVRGAIRLGFALWARLFSWAPWPVVLARVVAVLRGGLCGRQVAPARAPLCGGGWLV